MNLPYVSVVLPTYNRADLIGNAIHSVLNQTYRHFELLVIDDGSTDETIETIQGITDSRLLLIPQHHKGAAAARNIGMQKAKGKYIAFLDSDDQWEPGKIQQQLDFLETASDEIGGCVTAYRLVFPSTTIVRSIPMEKDFYQQSLKGCNLSPGSTLMFRQSCLQKVGLQNEILQRFEDWEWQIRFAQFYRWHKLPQVLANVRAGGHIIPFPVVQQAVGQFEKSVQTKTPKDLKTIKVAILYELFYAAGKNRLLTKAFAYLLRAFGAAPYSFGAFWAKLLGRKIVELFSKKL